MDICPECKAQPPDRGDLPPFVHVPAPIGVLHEADCPTLPRLTQEEMDKLGETLDAIDRAQAAAAANAHKIFIR